MAAASESAGLHVQPALEAAGLEWAVEWVRLTWVVWPIGMSEYVYLDTCGLSVCLLSKWNWIFDYRSMASQPLIIPTFF